MIQYGERLKKKDLDYKNLHNNNKLSLKEINMKTLLLITILLSSLNAFAKGNKPIKGVIKQVQCNRPSGLGIFELQTRKGKTITMTWYKVDSKELCSDMSDHRLFLFDTSKLAGIGADNTINRDLSLSELVFDDQGMVIDVLKAGSIDVMKFTKKVKTYKTVGAQEAHAWFFHEAHGIDL